jgi:hypothetical protein
MPCRIGTETFYSSVTKRQALLSGFQFGTNSKAFKATQLNVAYVLNLHRSRITS